MQTRTDVREGEPDWNWGTRALWISGGFAAVTVLTAAVVLPLAALGPPTDHDQCRGYFRGMEAAHVRDILGEPERVARPRMRVRAQQFTSAWAFTGAMQQAAANGLDWDEVWRYPGWTRDRRTGQRDRWVHLYMHEGRVVAVRFIP
jgi:hypothetical protein